MNTHSKLKIYKSGDYSYLYIYYKLGKVILRIPTGEKVIKNMMTSNLLFNSKVEDYESKNKNINYLKSRVDMYIAIRSDRPNPRLSQKECIRFVSRPTFRGVGSNNYIRVDNERANFLKAERGLNSQIVDEKPLLQYIDDYVQYRKERNTTRNTAKEFTTLMNRVKNFDLDRKQTSYFSDINFTWADAFEKYLLKKEYNSGTIEKSFTILITILNHFYVRKDEMKINLSDKFKLKGFKRGEKSRNMANPLTFEQFKTLYDHKFKEDSLEKTRIKFCLQCSTGLRFSDMFRITPEMINDNRIIIKPVKTERHNITAVIDLNPYSTEILAKLNYNTSVLKIENAPYNRNIKTMFEKLQEDKPDMKYKADYGSHCGRDTFISICVQQGVDFKTILTWTGQSSYSILDRYIHTTNEYKAGQMQKAFS